MSVSPGVPAIMLQVRACNKVMEPYRLFNPCRSVVLGATPGQPHSGLRRGRVAWIAGQRCQWGSALLG